MSKITKKETKIDGVFTVEPTVFKDNRGFFAEIYNKEEFKNIGILDDFVQDNYSYSHQHVLRGLHLQKEPHATSKLVQCVQGEILDIVVDVRKDSSTFKKWESFSLSEKNHKMVYVPKGFAHGFLTLSNSAKVLYKVDEFFYPDHDAGIRWDDPDINISWPVNNPILSKKDKSLPLLKDIKKDL